MSLPNTAEVLVSWVPASCMPSPESPAIRMVTDSTSWVGRWPRGWAGALRTVMGLYYLGECVSCPFRLLGDGVGVRGLVINRRGKVLDQVMDDPLDREDAHRTAVLVHDGQVAVAALLHAPDGGGDRLLGADDDG